jgi:hypothetical protein
MDMRKRFNAEEKALIAARAADGHAIHWKDASNWSKLAVITTGEILTGEGGWQYVEAVNISRSRTISPGHVLHLGPTSIREAPEALVDTHAVLMAH